MTTPDDALATRNVYVRLEISMRGPALPERGGTVDVWWKGARFRVRDDTGRDHGSILADLAAPRGLGQAPGSIEEIMDVASAAEGPKPDPTELFGDMASGAGWVVPPGEGPWPIEADRLVAAANQIFAPDTETSLEEVARDTILGRASVEYAGTIRGTVGTATYTNQVSRVVSAPYLLLEDARDARNADYYFVRRALWVREDQVQDADVRLLRP